ncbi:hypothetical protein NCLIV_030110 [Neospora caninum Liverpool]|uniref:Formate/nitrite transporter protein n=1 Tax=Neospora caninum (strain Liverpool) TaxID=572307 RepID=F0VJZ4_NEOCL|nr:hypothetical protein NCLIV_030110 [Neospora caninum Liverpool]CBZ53224.1 hypothetical protein NCLIV_030110 [Neospora caninum Liverpool]|eukprot:XP_003883256.1 hypothetical protein NCLIV_030110 [Neospora caninum Liverpool]
MVLAASPEAYRKVIEYGIKKTKLRIDRLFLQAVMAGIYVGMAGHACTALAGGYSTDPKNPLAVAKATQKFLYASLFPVAFIAIIFTGAELFTGNTMTMLVCLLERRVTALQLLVNWVCSLVGNWAGALFAAYFLSYLPGGLQDADHLHYLQDVAAHKTAHSFAQCFFLAVGCNTFVCLAVWFVIASDDAAGKIMSMWFPIVSFCVAGYEHIIANFYTLQCALMHGVGPGVGTVIVKNFIPTLLGNMVGGCGLVGAVYWYNFYPTMCVVQEAGPSLSLPNNPSSSARQVVADLFSRTGREGSTLGVALCASESAPRNSACLAPPAAASFAGAGPAVETLEGRSPNVLQVPLGKGSSPNPAGNLAEPSCSVASEDCLVVPRASFGGEYRPPQLGGSGVPAVADAFASPLRGNSSVQNGAGEADKPREQEREEREIGAEEEKPVGEDPHPTITLSLPPPEFHPNVPSHVEHVSVEDATPAASERAANGERPASSN